MKLLLDTHILLWAISNDVRLPEKARKLIEDEKNEIYYSVVSLWEVEIQHLAHPEAMSVSAEELAGFCEESGFQRILVREKHVFALNRLKRETSALPHKDPLDRMLICQAIVENMMFITHDSLIPGYSESCILAV